ncbi:hypothetical protein ACFL7D_02395 [candidate division KSB1 bacterium]
MLNNKNQILKIIIIFNLVFLFFLNCSKDPVSNPWIDPIPFTGDLKFTIHERLESNMGDPVSYLELELETVEIYPQPYRISTDQNYNAVTKELHVLIHFIDRTGVFPDVISPAYGHIPLYIDNGDITLSFEFQGDINSYTVSVTDSTVNITTLENEYIWTEPEYTSVFRIPRETFRIRNWGSNVFFDFMSDFTDTLSTVIDIGNYSFPGIRNDTDFNQFGTERYFHYQNEDDYLKVGEVLEEYYKRDYVIDSEVRFHIIDWMNQYQK